MNKTDLIAKLLANENLTVIQEPVETASFDIKNRVLRLPQWKDMGNDLLDLLIGHEVGHALYTTDEFWKADLSKEYPHIKGYFNVIEDVRIEKLIKRRYPGLRKAFNLGYRDLKERDFFNIAGRDFADMLLIDKINLYFKAGFDCGVAFNADEKFFVRRAEAAETIQEVIDLSIDIYNYSKDDLDKKMQSMKEDLEEMKAEADEEEEEVDQEAEDLEYGDSDEDEDEDTDQKDGYSKDPEYSEDPEDDVESESTDAGEDFSDLQSKTEHALKNKLAALADVNTKYVYYTIPDEFPVNPIVNYKQIIQDAKEDVGYIRNEIWDGKAWVSAEEYRETEVATGKKFKENSKRVVNYLIKEFEMKKAASLLKRAKISKSGSLDTKKLYNYKLSDDIFKQVMSIPAGKNHGMIFLLDWSGSMSDVIKPTIEQVINLAMFCRGAQIPFQVFAFTNSYMKNNPYEGWTQKSNNPDRPWESISTYPAKAGEIDIKSGDLRLLELFSSKMTSSEFNFMVDETIRNEFTSKKGFNLGGTPLNQALAYMYTYIPKFKAMHNIEKMSLITLTDGASQNLYAFDSNLRTERTTIQVRNGIKEVPFVQDKVTKKSYELGGELSYTTKALLRMIKDRYEITVLGFYICGTSYSALSRAYYDHYGYDNIPPYYAMAELRSKMRKEGFLSMPNTGRDDMWIIPTSSTKIKDDTELETTSKDSAAKIAKNFSKFLNVKRESRTLLNRFIGWVA